MINNIKLKKKVSVRLTIYFKAIKSIMKICLNKEYKIQVKNNKSQVKILENFNKRDIHKLTNITKHLMIKNKEQLLELSQMIQMTMKKKMLKKTNL